MEVKVFRSIRDINQEQWDSIIKPDRIICRYDYLHVMEDSRLNDCDYRYLMVFDAEQLVAHTCIYSMSFDLDLFDVGITKKIILAIRKHLYSNFLRIKVIECGTPTALGNTVTVVDGYDKVLILQLITGKMEEYARQKKHNILVYRDFYNTDLYYANSLKKSGFRRVRILPNMQLVNNWQSFDDYLNDMRSRYRYRIKKFFKSLDNSGIRIEVRDHFSDLAEELTALWFQIYDHAREYKREILTPEYFRNMDAYLKDRSKVVIFKKDDEIIAFDFIIIDDYTLRPLFIGMNYKHNEENKLYFNILCQSVKMGIELGKKTIEMGITTIGPKKEIGAEVIPTYGYMRHLSPLANILVTNFMALTAPPIYRDRKHVFNRRYYERIYALLKLTLRINNQPIAVITRDISETGIKIVCEAPVKKGTRHLSLLGFQLEREENSFSLEGKIVWIKKEAAQYLIGIKFIKLHPRMREKLQSLIAYLKKEAADGND